MKPIVGIGTETKYGKVVKINRDGVTVDRQGVKEVVSFQRVEKSLKKVGG